MRDLIPKRLEFHAKYRRLSIWCIPLSMAAGIMPGPNVFLAYNLFRLYSHDRALKGSQHLKQCFQESRVKFVADPQLEKILVSSLGADQLLQTGFMLEKSHTEAIRAHYNSMPDETMHDLRRARLQQLPTDKK